MNDFVNAVARIISPVSSGFGAWIASQRDFLVALVASIVILAALGITSQFPAVQRRLPIILSLIVTFGATFLFAAALTAQRPLAPTITPVGSAPTPMMTTSPVAAATAT